MRDTVKGRVEALLPSSAFRWDPFYELVRGLLFDADATCEVSGRWLAWPGVRVWLALLCPGICTWATLPGGTCFCNCLFGVGA
jgi:hypothetical protein